ncbi:MAG: Rrf2 family transcriptional regulator, partial [Gammaproteobacteria bacterium]|nr:Rrf2 family transcriptional regulator [Gammaproteobacteria bacterium]
RGPGGGYRLGRPAGEIAVVDVIGAVDEMVDATRCGGQQNCQGEERCLTHELWHDLSQQIHAFLAEINLEQLVERHSVREVAARQRQGDRHSARQDDRRAEVALPAITP